MTDLKTASTINDTDLDQLYDQLDALRTVARGYCPTCGRGDAAPTVEDWQREQTERGRLEIANRALNTAALEAVERAERAEATITRVRAVRDDLYGITGARYIADMLDTILNQHQEQPRA
jgi:hypothetical protein